MKLTEKEIREQKKEHGAEVVNYFVRFMEARENWKALPEYFIKQVIENSDDIRTNKNTGERITRKVKRKVLHQLANRKTKDSTRKKDDA
tara:strand:+ start:7529 stop:7795 length:267 start_codon:yes stop_codon:yes gene_type:complete